jgi:hypothetical protein
VADEAEVTFAVGVDIDEYTVWHVNWGFSSGVTLTEAPSAQQTRPPARPT